VDYEEFVYWSCDMVDEAKEQQLLNLHGQNMADWLIAKAKETNLDLHPLLDKGYAWDGWLSTALGVEVDTTPFWAEAERYARDVTGDNVRSLEQQARCWQVSQHAIHLVGKALYPPQEVSWHPDSRLFSAGGTSAWERSWPTVQLVNDTLITVYFVNRIDLIRNGFRSELYALSVEHFTEFDWLEYAGMHAAPGVEYTLNDLLFDLVVEGQGVCLWVSGTNAATHDISHTIVHERAEYMARNFQSVMQSPRSWNGRLYLEDLRPSGTEHSWLELPEFRRSFGIDRRDTTKERHSIRVFQYGSSRYTLDRCLSLDPPGYVLYYQDRQQIHITPVIKVEGKELWGEGIAWNKAEEMARKAIHKRTWRDV
jgi:hypothetical protein